MEEKTTSKLKVAVIVPSLEMVGAFRMAYDLSNALKDRVETDFFFFEVVDNPTKVEGATEMFFTQLRTFEEYDIVHSHGFRPNAYIWYHSKNIKAKKLTTLHSYIEQEITEQYNRFVAAVFWRMWKYVSGENNRVVALSKHMRKYYEKLWETTGLEVIPNMRVVNKQAKPKKKVVDAITEFKDEDKFTVMSLAYASEHNGLDQVVRLLPMQPNVQYIHIGDGPNIEALKKLAEKLQVGERCLFLPSTNTAYTYLKHAQAFILPARSEGFPMGLLESVQLKVPAILSDIPVFKEYFSKEQVTFFELENLTSLTKAIENSRKNGAEKAEKALLHYQENFSPSLIADKYFELYQKLLEQD